MKTIPTIGIFKEALECPADHFRTLRGIVPVRRDGETLLAMHEGLRRICRGERYGFTDESGNIAIPIRYLWADDFREGRAVVETENGLGLINKSGREVIAAIYDDVCYDPIGGESEVRLDGLSAVFSYDGRQLDGFSKKGL